MDISREAYLRQCFILNESELRKLFQALEDFGGDISIDIKCKDGLNRHIVRLEELLEFENPPNKEIQGIILNSRTDDNSRSAKLNFLNDEGSNILIFIQGPEDDVVKLNSAVEERLASIKPLYTFFARIDFLILGLSLFFGFIIVASILKYIGVVQDINLLFNEPTPEAQPQKKALFFFTALFFSLAPFIAGFTLNHFRKSLFPIGVFAIGQGQKRHEERAWIRNTVVGGFFISIAAGIVLLLFH